MAQQAMSTQAACSGRFILGIGLSHQIVIEGILGLSFDKPARHMREYLEVLMPLLHQGTVDHTGELYKVNNALGPIERMGTVAPKVIVAALGPVMLKLAVPVSVTDDPDAARAEAEQVFAIYGMLPSYRAMLDREGAGGPGDVALVGDEDTVRKGIQLYAEAGVTDLNVVPYGDVSRTNALIKTLLPA
jgi:alkanesulfonate monooxygenase SsuD/methylene tetrahydromethanopterin reductase-like flavin-dependent oxidoreductase (luciferase family)